MAKAGRRSAKPKPTAGRRFLGVLKWLGIGSLGLALVAGIGLGIAYATVRVPDPNGDFQTNTTFVYFRDGKERLGSFSVQNRQSLELKDMPQNVKDAIVAAEDRSFWSNPGISIPGMVRAVWSVATDQEDIVGGSTITQQYIKVMYLTQEKSVTRKFKEVLLATKISNETSKEKILENYLNTVYFGRGAYGIETASQVYFDVPSKKLSMQQAVALCAIVNSPGNLDPANGKKQRADLLERYQYTINGLVEMGKITEAQKSKIYYKLPNFPKVTSDSRFGGPKGFLLRMVQDELIAKGFSDSEISGGGLHITTTFDPDAQDAAVEAAEKVTLTAAGTKKKSKNLHAAIASIDNKTGGVIALYGGPDFVKNSRNWATTSRPTGSTFKPYALTAALRNGWSLSDTVNGNSYTPPGDPKPVRNAGGQNYGRVNLLKATTSSINSAYVDLVTQMEDGPKKVIEAANDAGAPKAPGWNDTDNRLALGTPEVSPLHQAAAYSTFANEGRRVTPHVVKEVKDAQGKVVYKSEDDSKRTIEEDVAIDVAYALTKVAQDGTGRRAAQLIQPVAGKTGTAYVLDRTVASWFVGFTKQITTAVMFVAGDNGSQDLDNFTQGFYGSGYPSMLWLEYMQVAMKGLPSEEFAPPTNRVSSRQQPTTHSRPRTSTKPTKEESTTSQAPSASQTQQTTEATEAPTTEAPTTEKPAPPTKTSSKPTSSSTKQEKAPAAAP